MDARLRHPAWHDKADALREDAAGTAVPVGRACCCPATAVVRVVMPSTPARPHETELLLCGHHYRVSRQALAAAHATITMIAGSSGMSDALLPGIPGPRMPSLPS